MKQEQLSIKPLEKSQLVEASILIKKSWQHAYRDILPKDGLSQLDEHIWQKSLPQAGRYNLVLTNQERLVGIVSYGKSRSEENGTGELMAIYVLPNQTGKGIGTLLLKNAEVGLKALGYSRLVLWVIEQNKSAISFYEAHRWKRSGKQREEIILDRKVKLLQYEKEIE